MPVKPSIALARLLERQVDHAKHDVRTTLTVGVHADARGGRPGTRECFSGRA
jgi:hypothetical protein